MTLFLRLAGPAAVAGLLLAAALAWLLCGANNLDFESIAREGDRSRELDRRLFRCQERIYTMERLVDELSLSELSLAAAVNQSLELYEGDDVALSRLRASSEAIPSSLATS